MNSGKYWPYVVIDALFTWLVLIWIQLFPEQSPTEGFNTTFKNRVSGLREERLQVQNKFCWVSMNVYTPLACSMTKTSDSVKGNICQKAH